VTLTDEGGGGALAAVEAVPVSVVDGAGCAVSMVGLEVSPIVAAGLPLTTSALADGSAELELGVREATIAATTPSPMAATITTGMARRGARAPCGRLTELSVAVVSETSSWRAVIRGDAVAACTAVASR
jgi:hypothetical protein